MGTPWIPWDELEYFPVNPNNERILRRLEMDQRTFISPSKMAEQKTVVDARVEGFHAGHKHGKSEGFRNGLSVGILSTALFFILVYSIGQVLK